MPPRRGGHAVAIRPIRGAAEIAPRLSDEFDVLPADNLPAVAAHEVAAPARELGATLRASVELAHAFGEIFVVTRAEERDHRVVEVGIDRGRPRGNARQAHRGVLHELRGEQAIGEDVVTIRNDPDVGLGEQRRETLGPQVLVAELDVLLEVQLFAQPGELRHRVALAEDRQPHTRYLLAKLRHRAHREIEAVPMGDGAVVHERERRTVVALGAPSA